MTDKQLSDVIISMVILVDSREKKNQHILDYFISNGIKYRREALNSGDYSFECNLTQYNKTICVERKNSLSEIAGNFTSHRDRFVREFERAKINDTKMHIVLENATFRKIFNGSYRSQIQPQSMLASLLTWNIRYNTPIWFVTPNDSGEVIYNILKYELREKLKNF